jgi:hypothetical protein
VVKETSPSSPDAVLAASNWWIGSENRGVPVFLASLGSAGPARTRNIGKSKSTDRFPGCGLPSVSTGWGSAASSKNDDIEWQDWVNLNQSESYVTVLV